MKKINTNLSTIEIECLHALQRLHTEGAYIALSLFPPSGKSCPQAEGNTLHINEGRRGKFSPVSEAFYDDMVNLYDSRSKN